MSAKLFTFFADTHIGSKYLEMDILPDSRAIIERLNAYDVGDSIELKNCEPRDLAKLRERQHFYQTIFANRYVTGNHSCDKSRGPLDLVIEKGILISHGDILWDEKKRTDFRNERMGQGSGFVQKMLAKKHGTLSKSEKADLANYAAIKLCHTIVIGHVHPEALIDCYVGGIRVICLPRGKTEIII